MKKSLRIIFRTLLICVIVGGLGYGGYLIYASRQDSAQADTPEYTALSVITGNLEKTVTGTGSLSISQTENVTLPFAVTVEESLVREGEQVSAGDNLLRVSLDALKTTLSTLNDELSTTDSSILQLAKSYSDTASLTSSVSGRVKELYCEEGDLVQNVMEEHNALALLSLDGKMKVTIDYGSLSVGDSLSVNDNGTKYTGTVQSTDGSTATITFSDTKTLPGTLVQVIMSDIIIGTGEAQISMPAYYTSSSEGRISKVSVKINSTIANRTVLFTLAQVPISSEYDDLIKEREDLLSVIQEAKDLWATGIIKAPMDGIVQSISSASPQSQESGAALASLYAGDAKQMVVSVDELDIINVKVGQDVSIAMDAVTDKTYNATVSYISQIGSSSSGVTTYNVTLSIDGDEQLKMGMNGTATIKIETVSGAVLVPISALNSSRNGQYVWLQDSSEEAASDGNPGIMTYVTTGLSNDSYAEVLSGLSVGDMVLVTRSSTSGSSDSFMGAGMFNMGGDMPANFTMPSGGDVQMPSGGMTRPEGSGGGQRPSGN